MYTLQQLREDLQELLDYNWADEQRDFFEQEPEAQKHHIFLVIRRLQEFLVIKEEN